MYQRRRRQRLAWFYRGAGTPGTPGTPGTEGTPGTRPETAGRAPVYRWDVLCVPTSSTTGPSTSAPTRRAQPRRAGRGGADRPAPTPLRPSRTVPLPSRPPPTRRTRRQPSRRTAGSKEAEAPSGHCGAALRIGGAGESTQPARVAATPRPPCPSRSTRGSEMKRLLLCLTALVALSGCGYVTAQRGAACVQCSAAATHRRRRSLEPGCDPRSPSRRLSRRGCASATSTRRSSRSS